MATDNIGRARGTDYFLIAEQLTESELDYLRRAQQFVDNDVLPVINDYWERAEFPFEIVEKLAKLDRQLRFALNQFGEAAQLLKTGKTSYATRAARVN